MNNQWLYDSTKEVALLSKVSLFKRQFSSPGGVINIKLSALGLYHAKLDNKDITDIIFTPGWTDYRYRVEYNTYTLNIASGTHNLEVLLADGWYAGSISGTLWNIEPLKQAKLFCEITLPDNQIIGADSQWLCSSNGPLLYSDIYMGEACNLNLTYQDFHTAAIEENNILLEEFSGSPTRRIRTIKPKSIKGKIVDFGENITGRERITFKAPQGATITIKHAEVLDDKGNLYTQNLRAAKSTNTIIATGNVDTYEPVFTFHGFRYIEVDGVDDFDVEAIVIHSDMPLHLEFDSSNPLLNQLVSNIRRGWLGNALDVPTDCPQRDERAGWLGDAQVFIKSALYLSDCSKFFKKWLKDVRLGQNEDNLYRIVSPYISRFKAVDSAGWADAGVICPWVLYNFTKDISFIKDNYSSIVKFVTARWNNFKQGKLPNANFGDWLNVNEDTSKELLGGAFLAYSTYLAYQMAEVLDNKIDAQVLNSYYQEEKDYFYKTFGNQLDTQTSLALAIDFNLVPEAEKNSLANKLAQNIKAKDYHLSTGFLGTPHLLHALSDNKLGDVAWKLLLQSTYPSWLFPVLNGATTVWEHWNSWSKENGFKDPQMNSFNHYAYGAVLDWIVGKAAGIGPDFNINPCPSNLLSYLSVTYQGVQVKWEIVDDMVEYTITVPKGKEVSFKGRKLPSPGVYHFKENITN